MWTGVKRLGWEERLLFLGLLDKFGKEIRTT